MLDPGFLHIRVFMSSVDTTMFLVLGTQYNKRAGQDRCLFQKLLSAAMAKPN